MRVSHFCYVDESGDAGACDREHPDASPVFVVVGLTVSTQRLKSLTWEFLQLKKTFEPRLAAGQFSDVVRHEIKGSGLRRDLRATNRNTRRRAIGFLDKTLRLVEAHEAVLAGKVVVKPEGEALEDSTVYPRAVSHLATTLEAGLAAANTDGLLILDSRTKVKNEGNVHSITTRRFRSGGDPFPHLVEAPVFGHSDTHVVLQVADVIASAMIFPIACHAYCSERSTWNAHVRDSERFAELRERFGARLQDLEYRYIDADGVRRGGFQVDDYLGRQPTHLLFRP